MVGSAEERAEKRPGIGEILASAPWKHALFTTYALSLGYFDSEVLRPLLRTGCTDIQLVVDAEAYRASLLERRSARVGSDYRLIPAAMPHGVFHAKCIYLAGDDEDLLLIGSGNVTFGGHGRNAEVFEALRSNSVPRAFQEFARFLESLGARRDIQFARREWIEEFADRAIAAARRRSAPAQDIGIRLVHSIDRSVDEQLQDLLASYGSCACATIMSPYHDHDGFAVRRLLSGVNAPFGHVAVTGDATTSPFPFASAATWDRPVVPVRLRQPEKRFVHAKWYEFETTTGRLLLTGSINATQKALTTTDNVELGVLRPLSEDESGLDWEATAVPAFAAQKQMPSGLGGLEVVYATFDRTEPNRLHGQLITLQPADGVWNLRLVHTDGISLTYDVQVSPKAHFTLLNEDLEIFSQLSAVQIILTMEGRQARGWVQNDMLLGTSARRRLTAGAMGRLIRREASDDDIQALLDYLSIGAEEHLGLFNRPIAAERNPDDADDGDGKTVSVHIDELAPIDDSHDARPHPEGAGIQPDDQFHAVMQRLRRMLLGNGLGRQRSQHTAHDSTPPEHANDVESGRTPDEVAYSLGLFEFEREIWQMVELSGGRPEIRSGLLSMLLEVSLAMRLHRLDDKEGAHEFLNIWLFKACQLGRPDTRRRTALQQHVSTTAATLYILAGHADRRSLVACELHDALETFYHGPVDQKHALGSLISDPQAGFAATLIGDIGKSDLADALRAILSTPTRRQQLQDAVIRAERGEPIPAKLDVFQTKLGKRLLNLLQRPHPEKMVRRALPNLVACAFDYYSFAPQEAAQYRRERIGYCIHCQRFTVNTTP